MSKESAAAILVQTLFTADKSMQNLLMSHSKAGTAKPEEVVKFVMPFYAEMLKAVETGKDWKAPEDDKKKEGEQHKENAEAPDAQAKERETQKEDAASAS